MEKNEEIKREFSINIKPTCKLLKPMFYNCFITQYTEIHCYYNNTNGMQEHTAA